MRNNREMKILILSDNFPPESPGGAGIIAYNLAKRMQKSGHEVYIITTTQKKPLVAVSNFGNLKIYHIYSSYHPRWQAYLSLYNPQTVSKVKKIIKKIKPDIVHAHNIHHYLSYYCLKIAKKNSKAVFLTTHDAMLVHYEKLMPKDENCFYKITIWDQIKVARKRYNPFRNIIIRHYLKYADKIFAVSSSLKKLLKINGIKNVETIYNGINIDSWRIDKARVEKFKKKYNLINKKVTILTARLIEAKGGDQLIKFLALVNQKFPNLVLLIVGREWAYTEKIKKLADKLGIRDKVILSGQLKEKELKIAYHSSNISVLPSLCFEAFGMTNLQAMACKKPVVSSYFGGPSEVVVDEETGYLVNPNNVKIMAEKILDLLKNPEKAKKFGEAGYRRAKEKFSLDRQAEETLKWYKKYV